MFGTWRWRKKPEERCICPFGKRVIIPRWISWCGGAEYSGIWKTLVDRSVSPRRLIVTILGGFAGFALILASLGIYGVISYSVTRRKKELGIRMALGASGAVLRGEILRQTLRLTAVGLGVGLVASWGLLRLLQGMLFGITASDPATFVGALLLLVLVAALAGYVPAMRASRLNRGCSRFCVNGFL
jgi:putative ABC transport system permease protein